METYCSRQDVLAIVNNRDCDCLTIQQNWLFSRVTAFT